MILTAETITDEQIRREVRGRGPNAELLKLCSEALARGQDEAQRHSARARCAEILNHRARRFFHAINGVVSYSLVALDIDHCKSLLVKHGCVFETADGEETQDIERAAIDWVELAPAQAALRMTSDDGTDDPARRRLPLSQRALGDWFCSEY